MSSDHDDDLELTIRHKTATGLSGVGFQVWRGSLFLADYLLAHPGSVRSKTILEIGSGTGLTSITALLAGPKRILATDLPSQIHLIRENLAGNSKMLKTFITDTVDFQALALDVTKNEPFENIAESILDEIDVVLCADVVYDEDITKGEDPDCSFTKIAKIYFFLKGVSKRLARLCCCRKAASKNCQSRIFLTFRTVLSSCGSPI